MVDETPERTTGHRRGRPQRTAGSSVLTPPVGMPLVPGLADAVPTQRQPTDWRTPAAPRAIVEPCVCGHARAAHDHYRAGTDCGACGAAGCESYQPAEPARKSVLKALFGR